MEEFVSAAERILQPHNRNNCLLEIFSGVRSGVRSGGEKKRKKGKIEFLGGLMYNKSLNI